MMIAPSGQVSTSLLLRCMSLDSKEEEQEDSLCLPIPQDLSPRVTFMDRQEEPLCLLIFSIFSQELTL